MSLIRAKDAKQNEAAGLTKPIKPSKGYPGIPPEDIGQYINAVSLENFKSDNCHHTLS